MFVIRDMQTGDLVGQPFSGGGRFQWHGVSSFSETTAYHGAMLKDGSTILQKVYSMVELAPTGSGPVDTVGSPTYDSGQDRVTRTHTLSDPALTGAALTAAVNAEADRRILLAYPLSEQLWASLRASQLIWKKAVGGTNLTAGENTTMVAIGTAQTFINAVRVARLALIATGSANTATIVDNANWPAQP
jgi:hypothetical protein